jgi:DNA-directed RNA polymerase specialized sigma24 family protein
VRTSATQFQYTSPDFDLKDLYAITRVCISRLTALPRHYGLAVELRHVHGLSYVEIAEALDKPVNTVKVHVHRGLALLRVAYEAEIQS